MTDGLPSFAQVLRTLTALGEVPELDLTHRPFGEIERSLRRRMRSVGSTSFEAYLTRLREPAERAALVRELGCTGGGPAPFADAKPLLDGDAYRALIDDLPILSWVLGPSGRLELVNQSFQDLHGRRLEELAGELWQDLLHPEDGPRYLTHLRTCLTEKRTFHAEARMKAADGSWRWIESWGRPRVTESGEVAGLVGTSADVTDRRRIEDELRDISDNIPQLAWMAHGNGWIFWYNRRWYEYTGTSLEMMAGWGWRSVHHPEHVDRVVAKISQCFESGDVWEDTFPLRRADGEYRWFLSRAVPIRDETGRVVRWFGTNTDVTEQRDVEQRLVDADRQKDQFLAMLGHELRNPLAAIGAASELLKAAPAGERLCETQRVIERQTTHMAKLLDSLLDVSRIIFGKIKLEREPVDFTATCRDLTAELRARASDRELDIRSELPEEPIWVDADRVRLWQMIDNLVSNAVKYTPSGGSVSLTLFQEAQQVVLRIQDTGIGIEPDLLPHVFEIFRQSEQSIDRSEGGLGLGLALVKTIAELHGGTIEARSEDEIGGAELVLRLPTIEAPEPIEGEAETSDGTSRSVLIVEDNRDAATTLGRVLELAGHRVSIATRGAEGVRLARESRPDIILCDLGLPDGMSGFDVATELKSDPVTQSIRIVALSGYGRPEDKARCRVVGFDAHLTKPVDLRRLEELIVRLPRAEA